jgi:hypothetical protein
VYMSTPHVLFARRNIDDDVMMMFRVRLLVLLAEQLSNLLLI